MPILAGHYGYTLGDDDLEMVLPDDLEIPNVIKPFLSGKIEIKMSILDPKGSEIVCLKTVIKIKD